MKKNQPFNLYIAILLLGLFFYFSNANAIDLRFHPNIRAYILKTSKQYNFSRAQLTLWFNQARFNKAPVSKVSKPAEANAWYSYRDYFVTQEHINKGVRFWQENAKTLAAAERRYGVPASVVVAIIGVETDYGKNKGKYSVMNTLTTLAFHQHRRSAFFQSELTQYLLLCREQGWDPSAIKGSYAGAIGFPQFMPSSYRRFAVDYNQDGKIDLLHNNADAIASVSNYLNHFGWKTHQPVAVRARITNAAKYQRFAQKEFNKKLPLQKLTHHGISASQKLSPRLDASVVNLKDRDGIQYWLTFNNFNVIKRYNSSTNYAMAVDMLSNKIRVEHQQLLARGNKKTNIAANE